MKVNVTGRGALPGVGILPARNIELTENDVRRLLNFKNVRVYDAETGELITPRYFIGQKPPAKKTAKPIEVKPEPIPVKEEVVEAAPIVETVAEPDPIIEVQAKEETVVATEEQETPVIEESIEEISEIVEETPIVEDTVDETVEETIEEVAPVEETTAEETTGESEEDKPRNTGNKKKRNRR